MRGLEYAVSTLKLDGPEILQTTNTTSHIQTTLQQFLFKCPQHSNALASLTRPIACIGEKTCHGYYQEPCLEGISNAKAVKNKSFPSPIWSQTPGDQSFYLQPNLHQVHRASPSRFLAVKAAKESHSLSRQTAAWSAASMSRRTYLTHVWKRNHSFHACSIPSMRTWILRRPNEKTTSEKSLKSHRSKSPRWCWELRSRGLSSKSSTSESRRRTFGKTTCNQNAWPSDIMHGESPCSNRQF